jgi:hypothetical protein
MQDLLSKDRDAAARAAEVLYASADRQAAVSAKGVAAALQQAAANGLRTAPAILLLGYTPSPVALLKELTSNHGSERVKLHAWTRPVPLRVAAAVALSRAGDAAARREILEHAPQYEDATRVFLLDVLGDIDSPEVWHALSAYLADTTEIREGVPSGAERRRVCDHAVDAFVDLLGLPITFDRNPGGRYHHAAIDETRRLFRQTVPR